jgi:tetratricopeptide (TPR) repeat protein
MMRLHVRSQLHERKGELKQAEQNLLKAAADTEHRFGQLSLNMLFMVERLARFYHEHGVLDKAAENYKRSIQLLLGLGYQETALGVISSSLSMADVYEDMGRLDV